MGGDSLLFSFYVELERLGPYLSMPTDLSLGMEEGPLAVTRESKRQHDFRAVYLLVEG